MSNFHEYKYYVSEATEMAKQLGESAEAQVAADIEAAGGNLAKIEDIYNKLLEDLYGDDGVRGY